MKTVSLQIRAELQQNKRLRLMLSIIVATIIFYILLLVADLRSEKLSELYHKKEALLKIARVQNEPEWFQRRSEAASQKILFQNLLWKASSQGLAQAKVQAYLRGVLDDLKVQNGRITLEAVKELKLADDASTLWKVSARIRASFKSDELQKILWALNSHPELITIRSLNFNLNSNKNSFSNFTLFAEAWFEDPVGANNAK